MVAVIWLNGWPHAHHNTLFFQDARMKFQGSQNYVATADLMLAVNAAITLKLPLLVKG